MCEKCYTKGFQDGLEAFAFWKEGKQYVGTSSNIPLEKAKDVMEELFTYNPPTKLECRNGTDGILFFQCSECLTPFPAKSLLYKDGRPQCPKCGKTGIIKSYEMD